MVCNLELAAVTVFAVEFVPDICAASSTFAEAKTSCVIIFFSAALKNVAGCQVSWYHSASKERRSLPTIPRCEECRGQASELALAQIDVAVRREKPDMPL